MKKTLKILSAISLTTPLSVSVIACGPDNNVKPSYLTDLGFETNEAYSLSSTTAILSSGTNQKAWFFDVTSGDNQYLQI